MQSQCPDRNKLWHRIIYLRDTSSVSPLNQLKELVPYLNASNQCIKIKDSTHVLLIQRIGFLHSLIDDYTKAIEYTQASIKIAKEGKKKTTIMQSLVVRSYYNLSVLYDSLNLGQQRAAAIDSFAYYAVDLKAEYNYSLEALDYLVPALYATADYYRCIEIATLGNNIVAQISKSKKEAFESSFNYFFLQVNALIKMRNFDTAYNLVQKKIRFAKSNDVPNLLGSLYGLYATLLRENSKPAEALIYYNKCFVINKKIGYQQGCAEALNNIGYTYATFLNNNKKAVPFYFKALTYASSNEKLNILGNIANSYAQKGKFDSAFLFYQKAFDQLKNGFTEKDLLTQHEKQSEEFLTEYITGLVLDKAEALVKHYNVTKNPGSLQQALQSYQMADKYFDILKKTQDNIQSKLFLKSDNRRLYEQAIKACYESHNPEMALYFFEKSRSVLLNDQILEQRRLSTDEMVIRADLKKQILALERNLTVKSASEKDRLQWQQTLFTKTKQLQSLTRGQWVKPQSLTEFKEGGSQVTVPLLRSGILKNSGLLFEIFNGTNYIFTLGITGNKISFEQINKQQYDSLTEAYNAFISNPELLNARFADFASISHQLYQLLFLKLPVSAQRSIIISPDGKSFPVEALLINSNYKRPDYLVYRCATSYTYSAQYLINQLQPDNDVSDRLLGIAPVSFQYNSGLADLPGSDQSLQKITAGFKNSVTYLKKDASRNNFLQQFPDFSVLQLYTHASESSAQHEPVIYFADTAFYLSDLITDRRPVTKLVVLSACQTANGKLYTGEGIFSFNRGFAALGIPSAVSNLWSVDNSSTYRITELFYQYLHDGLSTDVALQKAKIEFINTNQSGEKMLPYYWAASILTGNVDKLTVQRKIPWMTLSCIVVLILGTALMLKGRFLKSRT